MNISYWSDLHFLVWDGFCSTQYCHFKLRRMKIYSKQIVKMLSSFLPFSRSALVLSIETFPHCVQQTVHIFYWQHLQIFLTHRHRFVGFRFIILITLNMKKVNLQFYELKGRYGRHGVNFGPKKRFSFFCCCCLFV